ncbi:MAG: hemerythrin domain-containing protein [Bryobacteraceae bacterium]
MPVIIGAKPESDFSNPIGLLTDCHRRIERFLSVLVQVASDAQGRALSAGQRASFETALRYFREAAPKHTADEEDTLFPRLRQIDNDEARAVLAQVSALQEDHIRADCDHAEVDKLGRQWIDSGTLPVSGAARLSTLLGELQRMYAGHIEVEEREVFPVAARVLAAEERLAAGKEMAERRRTK